MLIHAFLLAFGFALLLGGGDLLVRGASALAETFGIPPLVIGLTVVAFGTSAPELSVNLMAAFQGNTEISFGNIIGSNIANIGLIIGVCAIMKPLAIEGVVITREIPMMVLASLVALVTGMDLLLRDVSNRFDRSDGLVFLLIFCVFLFYTIGDVISKRKTDPLVQQAEEIYERKRSGKTIHNLFLFILGLIFLVFGGKVAVDAAVVIAELLNVPRVIIGLTVLAIGTSLPELVTSVIATRKGQTDMAIGNVVGSNIFNLLFVNGICSTVRPISVPASGGVEDLVMMVFLSIVLLPLCISDNRKIVRLEGVLLLVLYLGFNLWRILG
ncbi:MAG: calcium/sodium antiporter [Desulfobacterium sp.]|nr:calcium/sodium antiporter [Desulfobacterium sp.]